ncbi:MAG TPA: HAD family hydrolase [Opitutaceae bacterium]|nr:HAD family hydrolase [Opitutaceae bacterium]
MPDFRTFLFDLDGTLVDHFTAIHRSHSHTMTQLGLPAPTFAAVRAAVGGGLENAIARLAGPAQVARALPIYREYWDRTMLDDVKLLPGARELLEALHRRDRQSAVFTNKHGPSARLICTHLGIDHLLEGVFGATDTPWLKPDKRFTLEVLEQLHADAGDTLFVGDSTYDIEAAHNAGLPCWCVTTGTHTGEELRAARAEAVYDHLDQVAAALA